MRHTLLSSALLVIALFGCNKGGDTGAEPDDTFRPDTDVEADLDSDGFTVSGGDCDDEDAAVFPLATEICNGVDDNCNDAVDEGLADADVDGVCDGEDAEDCDGKDNDGDGRIDEDFGDADLDGIADCADGEDCDGIDNDGDGETDEGYDADLDGYTQCGGDCDDADSNRHPGLSEIEGDTQDNDCDGYVDEGSWSAGDLLITELMTNPTSVADPKGEWFEVYNASSRTVVINGLMLSDAGTDAHQVSAEDALSIAPGEYFVLGGESDVSINGRAPVDYEYSGITLGNGSDSLILSVVRDDGSTLVIDEVAWDGGVVFPDPTRGSMTLEPSFMGTSFNDDGAYWCEAVEAWDERTDYGSPGAANAWCTTFDHDDDGYSQDEGDCEDADATVYPGAPEISATVDNDCDGVAELGPTAVAVLGGASEAEECGNVLLDASASSDPDGGTPLTYKWELTSAPATSKRTTADITSGTTSLASFEPDVDGDYVFSLTVWDSGGAASTPDSLTVSVSSRVTNSSPVSNAGPNLTAASSTSCTPISYGTAGYDCAPCADYTFSLDGSSSSDPDADSLTYAWSVLSGAGTVATSASAATSITVSSPSATYGVTDSETVNVQLKVTDCMGATATDNLVVSYSCTGG